MSDQAENKPIYFSHIPKTAGTSFTTILDRFYNIEHIFKPQLWWEVGDVDVVKSKDYQCFRGHFGMLAHVLSFKKLQALTILRNPVNLAYSTYQYVKRESQTAVHDYVAEKKLSFEAFLSDPRTSNLTSNRMVKSLCFGTGFKPGAEKLVVTAENYKTHKRIWSQARKQVPDEALIELANDYLNDCIWFGMVESFEVSMLLLCHRMSWPPIGPTAKLNSHNKTPQISAAAVQLVKQKNTLDFAFYECAKISFEKQIETFCQQHGLQEFELSSVARLVDENYQQKYLSKYGLNLTDGIHYDFSMVLLGVNWHRREWSDEANSYFRWTGPEKLTSIDFWLVPNDYHTRIQFINLIDDKVLTGLEISVNGKTIKWSVSKHDRQGEIEFFCEKGMTNDHGLFRLTIMSHFIATHEQKFNSNDDRRVGLAIKKIIITSTGS